MVVHRHGVRLVESKVATVAELLPPSTVEERRLFLGMTGYLRQFVECSSILAVLLTDGLRDKKAFVTKRARRLPIPWEEQQQREVGPHVSSDFNFPFLGQPICVAHRCK